VPTVLVPRDRIRRWLENFEAGHGPTTLTIVDGRLRGDAEDGSWFDAAPPFDRTLDDPTVDALEVATTPPDDWGILLVRKGGFAVARLAGEKVVESKVGQRHVQGRTKAGGQSQQRFARRRDNQARAAYEAAADHAVRIVAEVPALVVGGDHPAVTAVLDDPRLRKVAAQVIGPFLTVPDPRRGVLDEAVRDARSIRIEVANA
jgi:peptide subunit release factor 1 (eRF1)